MSNRLFTKYFRKSLFNRILLAYAAITIVSIFILTEVILYSFIQTLERRELSLNRQIISRVSSYVDKKYRSAINFYQRLYVGDKPESRPVYFFEPVNDRNRKDSQQAGLNLSMMLVDYFRLDPDINDVVFRRYGGNDWYVSGSSIPQIREAYHIPLELTMGNTPGKGVMMIGAHQPAYSSSARSDAANLGRVFTLGAVVMSVDLSRKLGELYVEFKTEQVKSEYYEYKDNLKGYILILTKTGDVIFDSSNRYYGDRYPYLDGLMQGGNEMKLDANSVVNIVSPIEADLIVAGIIPKAEIYTVSRTIRRTVYLISIVCILASLLLSYFTTSIMSHRIKIVTDAMRKLRSGDLSTRIAISGKDDEISDIANSFNKMCSDLQNYINIVYLAEIKQKNAQMSALQFQINPHFLYNTLEAIRMTVITEGNRDAGEMIRLLTELFRRTIREEIIIEIRSEIKHCEMFLDIFKIRFGDRLITVIDVDDGILSLGIVKHLMQPIVENYIVHGFQSNREDNRIEIAGRQNGSNLVLTVKDNGAGIDPDRLKELRESLLMGDSSSNIGLSNVNERIRLFYGEQNGIEVDSQPGRGTTVTMTIQYCSMEELKRRVQDFDSRR